MKTLNAAQIETLQAGGHVVHIMPRKRMVRVDGWQMFRLVGPAPTYQPSNLTDMRDKLREEIANTGDT